MEREKRSHQRSEPVAKATKAQATDDNDPIERLMEWQEHRYDPGYYTGGKIDPVLLGERPNKYGYFLILSGALTLIVMVLTVRAAAMPWYGALILTPVILLVLLAGFKLIRGQGKRHAHARGAKKISKH